MMRNCWVGSRLMKYIFDNEKFIGKEEEEAKCSGFMCNGDCYLGRNSVEQAITFVLMSVGSEEDLRRTLIHTLERRDISWADSLDRHQIWNQRRRGWHQALIIPLVEYLNPIVAIIYTATEDGASIEQLVTLVIALLCQSVDCLPECVLRASRLVEDILPASCKPLGDNLLIQLILSALYSKLLDTPLAEALCHLTDVDLAPLLDAISDIQELPQTEYDLESSQQICELQVSHLLLSRNGKISLKVLYEFLTKDPWIMEELGREVPHPNTNTLLFTMFHIGQRPFDQVLSGEWRPDWDSLLSTPLGVTPSAAWEQIKARLPPPEAASEHDKAAAIALHRVFEGSFDESI